MSIIRVNKTENYSVISNIPLNDTKLSWEARGIMGYLLSKPNGWVCQNYDLINNGPAGLGKIERILDELQERGYVKRTRFQKPDGTFGWNTDIYESPVEADETTKQRITLKRQNQIAKQKRRKTKSTIGVFSRDGSSRDGLTTDGKPPDIVNTESASTESVKIHTPPVGGKDSQPQNQPPLTDPLTQAHAELDTIIGPSERANGVPLPPHRPLTPMDALMGGKHPYTLQAEIDADNALDRSGWEIKPLPVRRAVVYFLAYTPFKDVPTTSSYRASWYKQIKNHLDEFGVIALADLYRRATASLYHEERRAKADYQPPTGPWGYTKTMEGLRAMDKVDAREPDRDDLPDVPTLLDVDGDPSKIFSGGW